MRSPLDQVREALETFRREEAWERVRRWRGAADAESHASLLHRHGWLASSAAVDAVGEASEQGLLPEDSRAALTAQLAAVRGEAAVASARDRLGTLPEQPVTLPDGRPSLSRVMAAWPAAPADRGDLLAEALVGCAREAQGWLLDARTAAAEAGAPPHPDAGPPVGELAAHARGLLDATDVAADELVRALVGRSAHGRPPRLSDLVRALRVSELDGLVPRRGRWRRVASDIAALGFEPELASRVRTEVGHGGLGPRVQVAAIDPPRDVRLAPAPAEHGVVSELAAAEGVGRALGLSLVAPGLPVELRRPVAGSVARALGTLVAQVQAERAALARVRGLGGREAERLARLAGAVLLLETRLRAAEVVLLDEARGSQEQHRERAPDVVRRALGVEVAAPLAALAGGRPTAVTARYRGRVVGLGAWAALRERHDEDWYRNPRAEEPLRAGAHRGGWLSAEQWAAEELGAPPGAELDRLRELVGG
ncbi:MAG: hypothetical protein ACODAU_08995 [Myxococcota bacterium]